MMLRKLCSLLLCLTLMLGMSIPIYAASGQKITVDPIKVMVGGKDFLPTDANGDNVPVFAYNGTTYAPLRALAEAYGLTVGYNAEKNLATVDGTPSGDFAGTKGTKQVLTKRTVLSVTPINIEVGGTVFKPKDAAGKPVSVFAYNGTTYAPLRALAEAYGLTVGYDSEKQLATVTFSAATVLSEEKDAQLHADLQTRIDEILNTETKIVHSDTYIPGETYTGKAYYVSNDGDDENDGLTPETAWQSFFKVSYELSQPEETRIIQPGDAVFFRRGDTFRSFDNRLGISIEGITISAYGEGDKPIITGSSENGSGAEKWKLIYEDETGKKIWQYYRDMHDIARIVMNDGEVITSRVYEYYDESYGYISCEDTYWWMQSDMGLTLFDTLLPLEETMTENHTIVSRPVRIKETPDYQNYSAPTFGPLYLRCDEGNPGELFESIEFTEYTAVELIVLGADDLVIDNISFRCAGHFYMISAGEWYDYENRLIQNCEFAYGGCTVNKYMDNGGGSYYTVPIGDGIYRVIKNTIIRNNYFHDAMSTTATYERGGDKKAGGYFHVLDNVMVNTMGVRLDSTDEGLRYLDSVIIRGNQIWNNGHFDNGRFAYSEGAIALFPNNYGECIIEDNLLYCTENGYESNALLNVWYYTEDGDTVPQIRNNTYVQYADRKFGYFSMYWDDRDVYMNDPNLLTKAAEMIGDTTSEFYVIK